MEEKGINDILEIKSQNEEGVLNDTEEQSNYRHEKTLRIIATIVLVVGILATFIMLFTVAFREDGWKTEFNPTGFAITITTCLSSVATWALLNVICNISINLYKMNDHIENKQHE